MMQKTYLSREMTRAMALDHPIGDPTGGAAYGEKNDPVSAIISIGTMFMTGGAMVAGSVMAGVAFAGAAVSLIGNVTGNKSLSQLGMVVGLVGGLGSMGAFGEAAQGATWSSLSGSETAAAGAAGNTGALSGTESVTPVQNGQIVEAAAAPTAASAAPELTAASVNTPSAALAPAPSAVAPVGGAGTGTEALMGTAPSAVASPVSAQLDLAASGALNAPATAGVEGAGGFTADQIAASQAASQLPYDASTATRAADFAKAGSPSYLDQFGAFAQKNPMAAYGLINVGAQALGGVAESLSGKTDAEIDALKAQTGYADAKALEIQAALDKEKARRANLNAGYTQVNTRMAVDPNASVVPAWQTSQPAPQPGLIAGARTA